MTLTISTLTVVNVAVVSALQAGLYAWLRNHRPGARRKEVLWVVLYVFPLVAFLGPFVLFGVCERFGIPVNASHGFVSVLFYAAFASLVVAAWLSSKLALQLRRA